MIYLIDLTVDILEMLMLNDCEVAVSTYPGERRKRHRSGYSSIPKNDDYHLRPAA